MAEKSKNSIHPTVIAAIITSIIALVVGFGKPFLENFLNKKDNLEITEEKQANKDDEVKTSPAKIVEEDLPKSTQQEKEQKKASGILEFKSKPKSDFYYIGIRGTDNLDRIGLNENFNLEVNSKKTFITIDVYDENKNKITSKTTQCCDSNLIIIRIP